MRIYAAITLLLVTTSLLHDYQQDLKIARDSFPVTGKPEVNVN